MLAYVSESLPSISINDAVGVDEERPVSRVAVRLGRSVSRGRSAVNARVAGVSRTVRIAVNTA